MTHHGERSDRQERDWQGAGATHGKADDVRSWVIWGVGADPERAAEPERDEDRPGEPGTDVAWEMAQDIDPDWASVPSEDRWVVVLEADEGEVDSYVLEDESASGYAPYLVRLEDAEAAPTTLRGVLRGDVVKRRKEHRFDAARPF